MSRLVTMALLVGWFSTPVWAEARKEVNHQGVVKVSGVPFNGTGLFRFAIVDPDAGINRWSNDGSINGATGGIPTAAVSLSVENGVYTVNLGDTGVTNMTELPSAIFGHKNLLLRIWFDDGVHGIEQLAPDHKLTPAPYAHSSVIDPPIGSIVAWHKSLPGVPALHEGWMECNGQLVVDPDSPLNGQTLPNLNSAAGHSAGRFLRGGSTSGEMQVGSQHFDNWDTNGQIAAPAFSGKGVRFNDGQVVEQNDPDWAISRPHGFPSPVNGVTLYSYSRPVNMTVVWIIRVK